MIDQQPLNRLEHEVLVMYGVVWSGARSRPVGVGVRHGVDVQHLKPRVAHGGCGVSIEQENALLEKNTTPLVISFPSPKRVHSPNQLTLSLPRVINFIVPLQPLQKYVTPHCMRINFRTKIQQA